MPRTEFANQKALVAHAERNDLAYEYEHTPAFAKWQRLLSPDQYEIAEVRTSRGVSRVMLFPNTIVQAEREANAPLREAMAIKRERLRALRAKRAAIAPEMICELTDAELEAASGARSWPLAHSGLHESFFL
jgi:hypothetical protein